MIQLEHDDFRALKDFKYLHHWTNPRWNVLPESALAQIRPLREEKVKELWEHEYVYFNELYRYAFADTSAPFTSSSLFAWIQHIDIARKRKDVVQQYLRTFESRGNQIVVVIWDLELAVGLPWHIFCTYWDDFTYPSDEAVSILPVTEAWYLEHHHEDQLIFGRPRLPLLDEASRRPPTVPAKPLIHRDEVLRLLQANEKIAAIKLYHEETSVPFKEAIDAVNKLLAELQHSPDQP